MDQTSLPGLLVPFTRWQEGIRKVSQYGIRAATRKSGFSPIIIFPAKKVRSRAKNALVPFPEVPAPNPAPGEPFPSHGHTVPHTI